MAEIEQIKQRFEDSIQALNDLTNTANELQEIRQSQAETTKTIEDLSQELTKFLQEFAGLQQEISEASNLTAKALSEVEPFLQAFDLTGMQSSVADLDTRISSIIEMLDTSLKEARDAASAAEAEKLALQNKINSLPQKVRLKHNL